MGYAVNMHQDLTSFMFPERQALEGESIAVARAMKRIRSLRDRAFPDLKFSDPAWNILLDLFLEESRGRGVCVTSLCIAAGVPTSTAIRCINAMVGTGALTRSKDREDGRRIFVELSERSRTEMHDLFALNTRQRTEFSHFLAR